MLLVSNFKEREGLLYVWVYGGDRCAAYCCQNHISLLWFAVPCCVLLYMCCCVGVLYIGQNIHWSSVLCCSELRYFVLLYLCINTHLVGTTLLCCALWCHVVLYSTLSCFDVLCSLGARYIPGQNHITRLCSSSTAAIQTRAAYCCRHPAGPAISATSSPLSVSMSHKPSFSTDFSGFQPQFGRTYRPILVFQKETEDRVKTSFMRSWDEKNNQERGPRPFDWIHRFPWLAELGTLILFVHLHWDSARFMLMNAPDSTIWPLQGNSGEHNRGPIPTPRAIRKREIEYWIFCHKGSTLKTFSGNDFSHFHWLVSEYMRLSLWCRSIGKRWRRLRCMPHWVSGKNTCLALKCNSWSVS